MKKRKSLFRSSTNILSKINEFQFQLSDDELYFHYTVFHAADRSAALIRLLIQSVNCVCQTKIEKTNNNSHSSTLRITLEKKRRNLPPVFHGGICFTFLSSKLVRCIHLFSNSVLLFSSCSGEASAIAVFSLRQS